MKSGGNNKRPCDEHGGPAPRPASKPATPAPADPARQKADIENLIHKISDLVSRNPDKAATILTDWTKQPAGKRSPARKKAA